MSVLIEDFRTALLALAPAGGVWYAINTTEPPVYPFIVIQRISSTPNVGLLGPSAMQNTRFQIDVYSRQISEASTIGQSIETLMAASSFQNVPITLQDFYESEAKVFRVSMDFSLWATNG